MANPTTPAIPPLPAEDHRCEPCDLTYPDLSVARALRLLQRVPDEISAATRDIAGPRLRRRPAPSTWSAMEYVCHVRDVFMVYTIRLHRTRTEVDPVLEPMLNDLRARRFAYNERQLVPLLDEITATNAGLRHEIGRLSRDDRTRTASRRPGERRTALWLVRQAAHEGLHHTRDITTVGERVAAQP